MSDVLAAEVLTDPLELGYAGMTVHEVADSMNASTRTRLEPLNMAGLREWAALDARGFNIMSGITDTELTDQQRNLCYVADKLLGTDDGNLDPGKSLHVNLIQSLVAAGVLTSDDKDALVEKATKSVSRATELKLRAVKPGHVAEVRRNAE